jgi:Fur family ferric uptake transcriptional regulator
MTRNTQQRGAIGKVLLKAGRPLSIAEVFQMAQAEVPGLGIATVYRNLKALLDEGRIQQVSVPGEPSRWEMAPKDHHHHFLCRTCSRLLEIESCPEDLARLLPRGYTLEEHDILLRGQCDACAATAKRPGRPKKASHA